MVKQIRGKKYGLQQMTICGDNLLVDFEAANQFHTKLNSLIVKENLTEEQLYSYDAIKFNFNRLLLNS